MSGGTIWQPGTTPTVNTNSTIYTQHFVASSGQTVFNLTNFNYTVGVNALVLFKNGSLLVSGIDYTETSINSFTLAVAANTGDKFDSLGFTGITGVVSVVTPGVGTIVNNMLNAGFLLGISQGGTGATTAGAAITALGITPTAIGAAARGANNDITSLGGLTTPLSVAQGGTGTNTGIQISGVRQTVLSAALTNGNPTFVSAGTGLALNLAALTTNVVLSMAGGFGNSGNIDTIKVLNADNIGFITLPASNTSFVYYDNTGGWGSTLAQPQNGTSYPQSNQSSLTLNGVSTDDFGNTWTNTAVTFSGTTPKYAGTNYGVFNGTTSKIQSSVFSALNQNGYTIRFAFYASTISTTQIIYCAGTASSITGLQIGLSSSKITLWASSNGSTFDIASAVLGITTLSSATWYDAELDYDPVTGKYFVYINGILEVTITSALKITSGINFVSIGAQTSGGSPFTGNIQGFEYLPYCKHPGGITFTPQTTLASISAANYAADWYSFTENKVYSPSAASTVAGTNPTFAAKTRVYTSQAVTGASSVSSVSNYPLLSSPFDKELGAGQTWQNMTASRAYGTTYYNTKGRTIKVSVDNTTAVGLTPIVGGTSFPSGSFYAWAQFEVPAGQSYSITSTSGALASWMELF